MGEAASERERRLALAESILGYEFERKGLLLSALLHASARNEPNVGKYDDRLLMLGASLLRFIYEREIILRYPDLAAHGITLGFQAIVSGKRLTEAAERFGILEAMYFGGSVRSDDERTRTYRTGGEVLQSLIAAVYLDGGLGAARGAALRLFGDSIPKVVDASQNPKTELQEITQAQFGGQPDYEIVSVEGPPHDRRFTAQVRLSGRVFGVGTGRSKRDAEAQAAQATLHIIKGGRVPSSHAAAASAGVVGAASRRIEALDEPEAAGSSDARAELADLASSVLEAAPEFVLLSVDQHRERQIFTVEVSVGGTAYGIGTGSDNDAAETDAATAAITAIVQQFPERLVELALTASKTADASRSELAEIFDAAD